MSRSHLGGADMKLIDYVEILGYWITPFLTIVIFSLSGLTSHYIYEKKKLFPTPFVIYDFSSKKNFVNKLSLNQCGNVVSGIRKQDLLLGKANMNSNLYY